MSFSIFMNFLNIGRFHDNTFEDNLKFVSKWMLSHIEDGDKELKKPVIFTEYGLSNESKTYEPSQRDKFFKTVLDIINKSAKKNRSGAGSMVWQLFVEGMEQYNDDYGIVPRENTSTYRLFRKQSCRLATRQGLVTENENLKRSCLRKQ